MPEFCHLHCHTQFSLLDGAASIDGYLAKAKADGMQAMAITDHGNMFGAFRFQQTAVKYGVKPIIGCEFYLVEDRHRKKFDKTDKDKRFHQLLLAKNEEGYRNIAKLCSLGFIEGLYSKYPRIDKELLRQYKGGLIATSCCVAAEVPRTFLDKGPEAAEKVLLEWVDMFEDDFYIELQRHGLTQIDQDGANAFLLEMSKKHNIPVIASNDSHYVDQTDYESHDVLLCVETGSFVDDVGRFRFENDQFYFKTAQEMYERFKDIPEALENTIAIAEKVDTPDLRRDILMPNYVMPAEFKSENDYLKHLSYEGAKRRYGELTQEVIDRIDFELKVIGNMGFAGYFLIVQDFIAAARDLDVAVGPGRGSAAGSAVAYCTGITDIDPIRYSLLFERFLNPERVSMPDIDVDFDDDGRQRVIDYVIDKYGRNQVAQIVTFGTMAAKSAINDVGRVLKLPLEDTRRLTKMVPDGPGVTLDRAMKENADLQAVYDQADTLPGKVMQVAKNLEGSIRQRGIHAAGVIIAPDDITNYIPVCTVRDSDFLITQIDGKYVEDAGMLKMDFLGLKTLSIINEAVRNIKERHGVDIDPQTIPLDDVKTFELYQAGDTVGTFQFESEGMRGYLKELQPNDIEDLIAMNALYRPGPMSYIPEFIDRKHGRKEVIYPHEWLEESLKPTYGIMVYQEQIMQCAQIMADYTLGAADLLRRAMGKKKVEEMEHQQKIFVEGAKGKGVDEKKAIEIFGIMKKFAEYGFNRSHSAAYSVLAYQTGYLKANYTAEYMAAVLTYNMNDIKKLNFFLQECARLGIRTLGPDVNESKGNFNVNKKGEIRFGMTAIKGMGIGPTQALIEERAEGGPFTSVFDITRRVNSRAVNRRNLESLAQAGALDCFGHHRAAYFYTVSEDQPNVFERAIRYGNDFMARQNSRQQSLFGEETLATAEDPPMPECEKWSLLEKLNYEKEVTGMYISGHPLDDYKLELRDFCNCQVSQIEERKNQDLVIGGLIHSVQHRMDRKGRKFARFILEDYSGTVSLALFTEDYLKHKHFLEEGLAVLVKGRYQARWRSEDQFEFKPSQFSLLSEVRSKVAKRLEVKVLVQDLSEGLVDQLAEVFQKHPGPCRLRVQVLDSVGKFDLVLASDMSVELSNELLDHLDAMRGVHYKALEN